MCGKTAFYVVLFTRCKNGYFIGLHIQSARALAVALEPGARTDLAQLFGLLKKLTGESMGAGLVLVIDDEDQSIFGLVLSD